MARRQSLRQHAVSFARVCALQVEPLEARALLAFAPFHDVNDWEPRDLSAAFSDVTDDLLVEKDDTFERCHRPCEAGYTASGRDEDGWSLGRRGGNGHGMSSSLEHDRSFLNGLVEPSRLGVTSRSTSGWSVHVERSASGLLIEMTTRADVHWGMFHEHFGRELDHGHGGLTPREAVRAATPPLSFNQTPEDVTDGPAPSNSNGLPRSIDLEPLPRESGSSLNVPAFNPSYNDFASAEARPFETPSPNPTPLSNSFADRPSNRLTAETPQRSTAFDRFEERSAPSDGERSSSAFDRSSLGPVAPTPNTPGRLAFLGSLPSLRELAELPPAIASDNESLGITFDSQDARSTPFPFEHGHFTVGRTGRDNDGHDESHAELRDASSKRAIDRWFSLELWDFGGHEVDSVVDDERDRVAEGEASESDGDEFAVDGEHTARRSGDALISAWLRNLQQRGLLGPRSSRCVPPMPNRNDFQQLLRAPMVTAARDTKTDGELMRFGGFVSLTNDTTVPLPTARPIEHDVIARETLTLEYASAWELDAAIGKAQSFQVEQSPEVPLPQGPPQNSSNASAQESLDVSQQDPRPSRLSTSSLGILSLFLFGRVREVPRTGRTDNSALRRPAVR